MITRIQIADTASYTTEGVTIQPKAINYIFGTNGTGKTTISRVIGNSEAFEGCTVNWSNDQSFDTFVYSRDFIENNFASQMNGVFTLGAEEKNTLEKIKTKTEEQAAIGNHIDALKNSLSKKQVEKETSKKQLRDACWTQKAKFEGEFREALTGAIGSKAVFCERVLKEGENNKSDLQSLETIQEKAKTLFAGSPEKVPLIPITDFSKIDSILSRPIWRKVVVGSPDIELDKLIGQLKNSDWVGQGRTYLNHSKDACPFCQQGLPHKFKEQLEQYFGGKFAEDMESINKLITEYTNGYEQILAPLEGLSETQRPFFEDGFEVSINTLRQAFEDNRKALNQKTNQPSQMIDLTSYQDVHDDVLLIMFNASNKIDSHNALIDNAAPEKVTLTNEVWRLIIEELEGPLTSFKADVSDVDQAISSLTSKIACQEKALSELKANIKELEKNMVSVQPTVDAINKTLSAYGFTGFRLEIDSDQQDKYRLLRNGVIDDEIHKTLSEGEKSFITFLYFYQLISGSLYSSGTLTDRVVVFDDPVSSLDSSTLFVVSSLVRKVISDVSINTSQIKQVFVLTHNVFFHKQVSFSSKPQEKKDEREFWVIRKPEGRTSITSFGENNPVKTTYDLLWQELKVQPESHTALPNALRRILEYYFNILGGIKFDDLLSKFEKEEKIVVGSLISWAHVGSHGLMDDIDYTSYDLEKERKLFKDIFYKTGNIGHFNMMMGADSSGDVPD